MDTAMTQEKLKEIMDRAVREVTEQAAGVKLFHDGEALSDDLCTVYISFKNGYCTSLTLCADTALLTRMARHALKEESPTPQDLEDFSKEYVNILCGKIAAALFRNTRVPARFSVPAFYRGRYTPEGQRIQFMLTYTNEHREGAQVIHHVQQEKKEAAE